jgi:ketosteroid isomerase-like protein
MKYTLSIVLVLCFSLIHGQDVSQIKSKEEVLIRQQELAQTIMNKDWKSLPVFLAEEMKYVHSFGRIDTKTEFATNIARFTNVPQWEHRNITVDMLENVSVVHSDLFVTLVMPDGTSQVSQQRSTEVWKKTKSSWVLVAHQSTSFK